METNINPYTPPSAENTGSSAPGRGKLFTPGQGLAATFLGGPMAGAYILWRNFRTMGLSRHAWISLGVMLLLWGLGLAGMIYYDYRHPHGTGSFHGNLTFTAIFVCTVQVIMAKYQLNEEQIMVSESYERISNWWTVPVVLLSMVFVLAGSAAVMLLAMTLFHIQP